MHRRPRARRPHADLIATPDGQDVVRAGLSASSSSTGPGTLTPRSDARGCITPTPRRAARPTSDPGSPTGVAIAPDGRHVYTASAGRIATLRRDSSSPICASTAMTVQHGFQGPIAIPCYDPDGDPLTFSTITPPTLGGLGAFDHGAASVIYAAPQGQNGSSTIVFRATYTSFGTFIGDGSVQVNVVGAPVVLPGGVDADRDGFTAGQDCRDDNRASGRARRRSRATASTRTATAWRSRSRPSRRASRTRGRGRSAGRRSP